MTAAVGSDSDDAPWDDPMMVLGLFIWLLIVTIFLILVILVLLYLLYQHRKEKGYMNSSDNPGYLQDNATKINAPRNRLHSYETKDDGNYINVNVSSNPKENTYEVAKDAKNANGVTTPADEKSEPDWTDEMKDEQTKNYRVSTIRPGSVGETSTDPSVPPTPSSINEDPAVGTGDVFIEDKGKNSRWSTAQEQYKNY